MNLSLESQSANVKKEAKAIEYIIEKHQKNIILLQTEKTYHFNTEELQNVQSIKKLCINKIL